MTSFPEDYFYLKVGSTSLVLDVERASTFFGFGGSSVKEGSKTVIASQKSEAENDAAYQLWRHENGYLVNKQTNLYLEVDNGKPGNRIVLHHQKPGSNGANQRWALTKEGYISLKSHPKYVIDVKGGNAKEGSHVVLSDSGSKSFAKSNSAKWEIVSLNKKRRNEGAIGIIRLELVEAKGLKSVDSFFAGGKSDPYVRVFHEGGQDIIAQTKFIDNNLDPVWNEVHYLPVNNIGDKFILDVMDFNAFTKDKPLGHCTFEVTKELVKEVSPNVFEGTPNGIDKWANLSIQGKLHYKAKFSPLTLSSLPKPTPDFLANLKEKPFDKSTLYVLITLQAPNGSFPPSDTLANLFGYSSTNELFELYKNHVHDDRVVNNTNKTIWSTSMVLWFLRYLLKEHRSEWGGIYERSERYITKELGGDLEIEEIVIAGGRKAVRERFEIKVVDDKQIITRENVKTHDVTRIIRHQTSTGAFQASDELAKLMSFNSSGQLRTALTRHINSQSKSAKITNYETQVWVTILVLYYFRLVGVDHKTEWEESYLRAYKWLWVQFKGKEKIEQEAFKIIESFVKERYSVKEDVMQLDEQFIKHIADKIDFIKKGGVSVSRGISAKKLHGVARIHIVSAKNLMKADSWFGGGASDPYVKIIGLSSGEVYGETRVVYNNINPEWNQVFYIPIYDLNDKIKIQIYDYNAFFKHVTLGSYVLDLKDFVKVLSNGAVTGKKLDTTCELRPNKGKLHFIADFHSYSEQDYTTTIISKSTITIQHLYILITYQRPDGGFELNDRLAKLLNFDTKEELVKSFTAYIERENDDRVKALHIDTWGTALLTAFLKTLLWEHRQEWMTTYTKAETYLSEIVTDIETEERLYTLANRFVIERFKFTEWESEEQKKSLGIIVQSKKIIITRRNVTIRHVRRFLSYQKESGCFELDNHLAETLGFSSAEEAKKSLETHFSSNSKVSKLDVNLQSSAIMIWFIRYVLVDFRGEWVDKYQTTSKWITEQVKDKQTEEELLEAARSFVRKRFDVDDEALKEDETFETTLALTPENIPSDIKRQIEEDEIKNENDAIVTDQVIGLLKIKIKGARNLPKSSSWFTSSKPDPYIKILDASGQEIVRTRTISETIEPKWEEVHYVSIHGTGESITFEIMDENLFVADKPLGTYVFETAKIVKKSEDGFYTTSETVREWFPLIINKKPSGELDMEVQFVSTQYSWKESFIFSKDTLTIEHIYIILSWRNSRGYFEFSDDVSHFFNFKSQEELKSNFLKLTTGSTELQSLSESALSTALVITYLKILCWKYRVEWNKVSANSEEWLSSEVNNIELEDKLYEICEKFIIEKFNVKDFEEEQKIVLISTHKRFILTRKMVTIRIVRRILAYQTQDGNIPLNNKTAELLGFENAEDLKKELQTYFKSENVKKVEHLWASACIIWYLRYVALDYRNDWLKSFEKTSEYLRVQCNDSKLEQEVLDCAKEFIRKRYQVDNESVEEDNKFALTLSRKKELIAKEKEEEAINEAKVKRKPSLLVKPVVTVETVKKYIKHQNKEGKFTFNDDIAKQLTFENSESLKTSINKHFGSKLTSKLDLDILTTAISIYYLRLEGSEHRSEWSSTYETSCKWLKQQIKDEEVESELLKSAKSYVIITYNVDNETIDKDSKEFPAIPIPDESAAAPDKGKSVDKGQHAETKSREIVVEAKKQDAVITQSESQRKAILDVQSSTTVEKTQSIISHQQGDGCYKLSDVVSKKLETSEETLTESIRTSTTNETIRKLKPEVLSTVLTISYLQTFANQHESHWKVQNEKARKYLIKEVGENKVEEILAASKKIVVERATNKVIRKQQRSAFATIQSSTTLEKTKSILSSFKTDHFEWNPTISKKLDISSDKLVSTCESYAKTEELKQTIKQNPTVWQTAIQLHYLELTAPHHEKHWRGQYDTARKYIKSQIKNEKLEKELWEASYKLCAEKATQKVIVKKRRVALLHLQSKTTVETTKIICSKQKPEGSIEISEEITRNSGISSDSILKTVETHATTESLKKVTNVDVWKTAISLSYLETYGTAHESTWKVHYDKARKFIKEKVKDEKLEAEILKASKELVIQKSTTNVIRKQAKKEKRITLSYLDKKTSPSTVISIVSKQKQDGSLELSTDLKKQLDVSSSESLVTSIESIGVSEKLKKVINSKDTKLVESALTISYLQNAASSQERNWRDKYDKAISYIRKEVNDEKLEKELLNVCRKYIVQKSVTEVVRKKQLKEKRIALTAAQSKTTVETTKKIVSAQKSDGSFELNEQISKQLDISSPETLLNTCHTVTTNERVKTIKDSSVWSTAITLIYLQYNASSHESTWKEQYDRARKYLKEKVNDDELEKEILRTTKTIVVEKTSNKVIKEQKKEEKRAALSAIQSKTDVKTITSQQQNDGSFALNDDIKKQIDISSNETLTNSVLTYTTNESVKKYVKDVKYNKAITTAITISYLKVYASNNESTWSEQYKKARKYLKEQINDDALEEEIIKTCSKLVVDKSTKKIAEKKKKAEKRVALSEVRKVGSVEKAEKVISNQKSDGSIELSDTTRKDLNISNETLKLTVNTLTKNEKLKNAPVEVWNTAISLNYLKINSDELGGAWKDKYEKARNYLKTQLGGDENAEKEILKVTNKIVVEKVVLKQTEVEKQKALAAIQSKTTEKTIKTVVSTQQQDGSFELSDVVCKDLDVSSETLITTMKNYVSSEKLKKINDKKLFYTVITLAYLQTTSSSQDSQWKDKYEKARKYVKETIKDNDLEEEILQSSQKFVTEASTNVVRKQAKQEKKTEKTAALITLKSKTTPETTRKIVENQKPDGSIKLDKTVSEKINISSDNIQSSVQTYGVSDKLKSVPKNVWETALSLRYLTITSDQHKEQSEKAEKYLIEELKDKELVEELLTTSEKIIVEKSVEKDKKETVATIQNSTTTEKVKEIVSLQKEDGSLEVTDTVSKGLDTESTDTLVSYFKSYFNNKGTKVPENKKVIDTAITLSFLRKTSSTDKSPELKAKIEKAETYLKTELGSEEKIKEILETTDTIVVEHATKKATKEKADQVVVEKVQKTITQEEITEVIETQNNEGSYEKISNKITEKLGVITPENISSSVRITDERVKKFDTKVWNTFITIAYCNKVLGKQQSTQNEKARAWLHEQIKDEKLEKEVLESCEKYVIKTVSEKTIKVSTEEKREQKKEKKGWGLGGIGSYFGSAVKYTTDTVQHTADTVSSTLFNLKSTTTPETTQKIVDNQKPDGSIKLDKTVSDQINISSDNIQSSIQTYGVSEKLKSVPKSVWETALSLRYLTITSQSQDQHKEQSEKAKKYLIEELKDEKLVEELLTTSEKIIVDQSVKKGKEDAVSTIKSSTTTEKATEIVSSQKEDGSLELTDTVSKALDVESNESLVSSIKTYFIGKGTKAPENKKVIDTAITLSFLRNTSSTDSSPELKEKVAKAEKYLKTELGSEEKIKELLEKTDTVVVDHAAKKVIKEKAEQTIVQEIQETITVEEITKVIEIQNKEGSYEKISDQITEKLGEITTDNISSSVRISDERVKKFDTKVWNTFITIAYCNKVLGKHKSKWTDQNDKARAWLHEQIKDEKLEKEVLESCEKIVAEKASNKKKESTWPSLSTSLTSWGSSWGKYITDTAKYTTDTVQHTADTVSSTLFNLKSTTTSETTQKIVENQKPDGSIKLDKTVSDQINISSDNIQSSIQTYGVSDKLKSVPKSVWETALSLRYLTITSQSQDQHKEQSEKAKKYLIEELKDEKLVEEILTTSEKIIVDQSVKKGKEDAVSTIKRSTTTEKATEIVSSQKEDGSLELTDTVSKALDVESNESLVSSIKTYFIGKGTKAPENKKVIDTAITLSFLRNTSSTDSSPELKEKVAKAEKYLKTELGSEEKIKELLEKTDTVVVDHAAKKVIKEKAEQTIVQEIQETVTVEEITKVIEIQNKEGSYEKISDQITEKLGEITTDNISSSVRISDERVKKFDTKVWNTFITIAYCNKVLGKHKSKWTDQNDKARAWLHEQIKDEKLIKEVLESCEKIVVEKASNKKKESSWPSLSTSLTGWGSSWGKYITDTAKYTTDTVQHTADTVSSTLFNLKSTTTSETTQKIVENQKPDGSIKLDKTVSDQINISSDNIQSSIQIYGVSDKLKSVPKSVWETALSLRYLTITSQSQDQHKEQSEKAKKYLIEELKDEKLVEEILTTSEKIIVDQSVKKGKEDAVSTIKSSTTTEKATEIVSSQKEDGSLELTDTVSKALDVESNESLVSSIKTYFIGKGTKAPENKKVIDTAITLSFLRNTSSTDSSPELKEKVAKAEKYLKTELGSEEKIKELLEKTDTVVVDHAAKKVIKEKAEQTIVQEIQETVTVEEITKVIEIQNKEGSYEKISDQITEKLGEITTDNISSSVRISDERVKKFDTKVWNTFITIAYCNKVLGKHKSKWTDQNDKARAWLHEQIKDEKLEKEVLESCEKIVAEKASNKKKESSWPSLSTSLTGWGSSWGKYITDTAKYTTDTVQHTADTVSSTLFNLKSTTTPETSQKIVENQKPDGSIKLDKTVSDQINISSDNIQSSIQTYGVSDKLKSVPKNVWETALSLRYLTITSQSQDQHKEQSEKAKKYLIEELKDEKLVEEILTTSEKIIVDQSVKKGKEDAVSTIKSSTTTEKAKEIVSSQKEDGSLELPDTVSKALDVESNESLVSSIKTYFIGKGTKAPENKKVIDTAITLSFLRNTSSTDSSPELKEKVAKAEKYLKTELGSEEKIKELLEKTDTVVVDHAAKKVIKEKAEQTIVQEIQKTVTVEEITKVIEIQNKEGSYEKISDQITEKLGEITTDNISSSVRISDERVKKFDTKVWNTFITIAYCNKVLGKHKSKWTDQNDKARAWLHEQIKDEKLEKEVLESCEKIVAEKASNKKKESSWPSLSTSLTGWGSSWGKYITDTAKYTTDTVQHTADTVSSTLFNLKSTTTPETTKKIVENQKPDGSIKLDKTVSDQINISSDNIQSSIQTYGVSDKLKSVPKNVWETALSLRYLTITSQSQDQHKEQSDKAKKYLIEELKDEKLVEEILTTSEKIIVDQSVKKGKEDAVSTIKKSTTTEKATEIVSSQKEDGSLELPDTVSKALDVESNESLVSSIKTYFIGKGTKAPENKKVIDTAITLSFLRNTSSTDSSPELKEKVAKAEKYLKTELGSEEKIKELLEKTDTVVVDHAAKKVIKEKAEQTIVQEIQKTVTEEEITKVIEIQNKEGSYEKISDQITEKLGEITTENISSSVRITDERVKKFDTKVWNTFITIAYCNKVLGKQQSKVKPQNEQALAWLHTQIKDEKLIKEVLESCEKIVVEKASNKKKESSWPSLSTSLTSWGSGWGKYITDTAKYTTDTVQHTADTVSSTLFNLKSTTTPETTKKIVENQKPDGSIKLDKTVSDQINISSDNIQSSIQTYGVSDKLKSVPKSVWETALSLRYLTITSQSQDQHKEQSDKAKKYLIEELKDEKLVEEILTTSEKIIVDQSVKKGKEDAVSTIKKSTTTEKATEIVSSQKEDGSLELPDTVSKALDVESNESLVSSIKTYFIGKGTKAPENKKVIDTAITLSFLRNTSSTDSSPELKEKVAKAEKYLKTELGSEEKIKELLEKTDTVVVDHAAKKVIKEKAEQTIVQEIQKTVTEEEITKVIEIQNKEGSYEKISDQITEKLGEITTENISSSVRITDERVKKFDTKVWNTFITIAYCNKVLGKQQSKVKPQNEQALAWLHTQIKDEKLIKEVLESCEKIVVEKASNKKKESSWPSLSTSLTSWGSGWGKYITDTAKYTTDTVQHTADTVSSTLFNLKSTTTPETTKKIVENQKPDGSIKLDKTVSDQINISSDNIQSSIQTYGVSDKLKSVPKNVWETALSLRYLTITSQSQDQHKEQSDKAKKYLIEELKDEKLVEEILTTSEKIIVDQSVKKGKEDAVSTIKSSTTTEKAKEIVSSQKEDGSLELPDTVSKALDVESNESLVSSIKTYFIGKGTKAPEDKKLLDTAITLSFLRNTSSTDSSPELKEKVAKAEKYLKTELGSEEKIKELLEKTDTVVVDHAAKKVIKEKAEQTIVQEIQETVTVEEITKVIEIQNKEGSYEKISDQITEKLGEITTDNISSSVRISDERVKKFDTKVWNTFITIAYCNKVLGKHKSKWTDQNDKARAWLHEQIKDEKLEKEVLESCEKIVAEKASNKKKESSWPSLSTSLTSWGSSWGKYITDTAKYTTDTVQHTADTISSTLVNLKSTTTPETTQKIVENQKPDGSIKLDKTVSDQINISSDNIQSSIQIYGVSDKLKSVPKNVWETALSLRYLTITSQSQDQHKDQSDKAKKYLIEELKDEKLVEEILTTSEKIIVDQSVKKGKEDAVSTIKSSTTTEKAKEIVSSQKEDGSLELPDTVSKALDVESNESLVSSIKTYFIGKGTKAPENKKVIDTAITLSFLRNTSSTDSSPELKEKVAKAEKYLKTELGSEEKIKELLEKTDTVVVDHAAKKVIKEKADQSVVQEIQETVTVEEITKVIEIQNKEGSYEKIPDKVTEKLGEITTENISSSVRITDERVKKFDTKVWNTFITIAYCNKVLGKHKSKWTDQNDKARAWLHEQIKDEKLEKEVLESCEKIVVEKVSNKKKESSPWFNLLPSWGSSDTTKQTTIKKIESIPVAPTTSTTKSPEKPKETTTSTTKSPEKPKETTTSTTKSPEKPKESAVSKLAEKFSGTPSTGSPSTASPATHHPKTDTREVQKDQPKKDQPTPAKPETESKTKPGWFDNISTSVVKLSKDIEDAITWGEKDDDDHDHEKVDALDTVKTSSTTKEVIQYVVSKQNDDGSIEAGETVCKQLDAPSKETIVTTVQQYITNEKLKNAKPIWITTAVNIAYLKNLADQHEGEWKEKYEIAHQYLTKEIGNPKEVDELIDASSKYVVKQSTQKVIKDKKKAAVLAIRSSTPKETVNDAISSQKNDGSFEISKTITKELNDTSPEDLVKKAQSYVKSDKIQPKNSDSIFKTALMLGYLRTATTDTDNPSSAVSEKYKKARDYLSSQIGDKQLEEDIIKASSKVVIDKSSEKVAEASKKEALKEIQITPEITKTIVSTQKTDGSFEVSKEITDKLNSTSPESLVTSVITYTKNDKLKNVKPSVWQTVISMQYLKNTASQHENDWKDKYNKAEEYVRSQLGDDNLVKELLVTSNKYVIDRVTRDIVKEKEERTLQVRKSIFDEDTKNTTISVLKGEYNVDDVRSICSSQKNDGSITLHKSIKNQFNVSGTNRLITNVKSYISNQHLRSYDDSVFETALTIYILRYVLVEHKGETQAAYERASSWLIKQLNNNKELEKELFSACEQYVIEEGSRKIEHVIVEEIEKVKLEVSEDTRQTVLKYLQERSILDDAHAIRTSQNNDGSFTLHSSILEQFKISSIDEFVKGITRYVGTKNLKNCDKSIWQTLFIITYFKYVLVDYESEWRNICEKANKWVTSKKLSKEELEELDSACDQYLIEKAVEAYNNQTINVQVTKLDVDETTKTTIYNGLRSDAKVDHALSLCKSQHNNGSFTLHKIISEQLKISSPEEAVETLKSYVGSLRLRRLDKSLWISAFIVTYFKIVLVEYESEWRKACDRASSWISEQVHNSDLEKELYSACEQYLIQQGCEFLNSKNTTIVTEVLNKPSQSVIYGSDGRAVTQKDSYLNSELIVAGAAARAKCKVKLESTQNKTLEDVSKATELALKYTEDEVNRLFDNNVTHGNKDDVLNRAKRATKFLMDEYYKPGGDCC
ncbi:unnamed protein product [Rhizophagus irregularis]|nr:unnamed protein product [Rhizophagus irregularis]